MFPVTFVHNGIGIGLSKWVEYSDIEVGNLMVISPESLSHNIVNSDFSIGRLISKMLSHRARAAKEVMYTLRHTSLMNAEVRSSTSLCQIEERLPMGNGYLNLYGL